MGHLCCSEVSISPLFRWSNSVNHFTARKSVYRQAQEQHPERWSQQLRNWDYIQEVYLNPEKEAA
ncbi:hypothetical protein E2W85_20825 [Salmonella enterica]|nr:hypothetical protein [Salmonella enterica]